MRYLLVAAALVAALTNPAAAHERTVFDPVDSPGPLDVAAARLRHGPGRIKLDLVTYGAWGPETLAGELDFVVFQLDDPDGYGIERCIVVDDSPPYGEGPVAGEATAYEDCGGPIPFRRPMEATGLTLRPDPNRLQVFFDVSSLWRGGRPAVLRFDAATSYENEEHPECEPREPVPPEHFYGTCTDRTGSTTHRRR
ncbi:MAG TPA: hypothetical protein VG318_10690 [Actinomycetota bacterium]|nr:hypothetical protein [Actinomycetota bacterium]